MATATLRQVFKTTPYVSAGGNTKGDVVVTGDRIGVVTKTVAAGGTVDLAIDFIGDMPKDGNAVTDGVKVNWASSQVTATLTSGVTLGVSVLAALAGDATARVAVSSTTVAAAKQAANVAALTTALRQTICIPIGEFANIADTNSYRQKVPFAFTVVSAQLRVNKPVTTANKKTTLTLSTTGGAVTGGVMAPDSTSVSNVGTTGAVVAASAISGANATGVAGDSIIITASSTTTFVEGNGYVEVVITNNDLDTGVNGLLTALKNAGIQASS